MKFNTSERGKKKHKSDVSAASLIMILFEVYFLFKHAFWIG